MEIHLQDITEEQILELSQIFKGISNPTRLKILRLLWDSPMYAFEIESNFDFERSNIAKHLNIMQKLGILNLEREGNKSKYSVSMTCIPKVIGCLLPYLEGKNH